MIVLDRGHQFELRHLDRAREKDNTTIAIIRWAAARARRFVHAKARA